MFSGPQFGRARADQLILILKDEKDGRGGRSHTASLHRQAEFLRSCVRPAPSFFGLSL